MGESEHIPGVALHVFGGDVRLAVNGGFSRLAPGEQRHILALCRETLGLALGERVQGAEWMRRVNGSQPAATPDDSVASRANIGALKVA